MNFNASKKNSSHQCCKNKKKKKKDKFIRRCLNPKIFHNFFFSPPNWLLVHQFCAFQTCFILLLCLIATTLEIKCDHHNDESWRQSQSESFQCSSSTMTVSAHRLPVAKSKVLFRNLDEIIGHILCSQNVHFLIVTMNTARAHNKIQYSSQNH